MYFIKKNAIILSGVSWLLVAFFSVIRYAAIFNYKCYFLTNSFLCRTEITSSEKVMLFLLITTFIVGAIIGGYGIWKRYTAGEKVLPYEGKKAYALVASFVLLASLTIPFGSGDFSYYFNTGKAFYQNQNPFVDERNIEQPFVGHGKVSSLTGFTYGPLAGLVFERFYAFSHDSQIYFITLWRLFIILITLACCGTIVKIIRLLGSKAEYANCALVLLLQPLFLFEVIVNCHFDLLWLLFVLLALWAAILKRWWLVIPLLSIGIWLKFIPLLLIPFFALWWWQELTMVNWKKRVTEIALSSLVAAIITVVAWWPLWEGFRVFDSFMLQTKWAANSIFAALYYSLKPSFVWLLQDKAHWFLTRLLQGSLIMFGTYLLLPYIKKVFAVIRKKEHLAPYEYVQMMFISLVVYSSLIQKSFWPWYIIWLLPFGVIVYEKTKNVLLGQLLTWLSLAPLSFYPIWQLNWAIFKTDAAATTWFWWVLFILIWVYPLSRLIKMRKSNFEQPIDSI